MLLIQIFYIECFGLNFIISKKKYLLKEIFNSNNKKKYFKGNCKIIYNEKNSIKSSQIYIYFLVFFLLKIYGMIKIV